MKKSFFIVFIFLIASLLSFTAFAQTEFKGGDGDGYASSKMSFFITAIKEDKNLEQKISLYPNPIRQGRQLSIALPSKSSQITGIRIVDGLGRFVYEQSIYDLQQNEGRTVFKLEKVLEEGAYIMLLDFARQTVVKKIVIFD